MKLTEGTKLDTGKLRYDLIPPEMMDAEAWVLSFGAQKYEDRNWEKGIRYGRVFGAAMRHLWAWWRGETLDPESGKSHLWHALCNISFLITYEARGMHEFDDRPSLQAVRAPEEVPPSRLRGSGRLEVLPVPGLQGPAREPRAPQDAAPKISMRVVDSEA